MTQDRSTVGSLESRRYCAACAFVRMIPRGSMITPLADIGLNVPLRGPQRMLTRATRAHSLIVVKDWGENGYGSGMRATRKLSVVVEISAITVEAGWLVFSGIDIGEELAISWREGGAGFGFELFVELETAGLVAADWEEFGDSALFGEVGAGCSNPTHCG